MSATAQGRGQPGWPGARPGPLSAVHRGDALPFANTAMLLLLDSQDRRRVILRQGLAREASLRA